MTKLFHSRASDIVLAHGTDGRTYGGDPTLVHIEDHHRHDVGRKVAAFLDSLMRRKSEPPKPDTADLCPGCYMIALLDASIYLAQANGQPLSELAASMSHAYALLAKSEAAYEAFQNGHELPLEAAVIEEITVVGRLIGEAA